MKFHTPFGILALFTLAVTGCCKHSPSASTPKSNDLGIIEVSNGKPSTYTLADGRGCTITPTMLVDGKVRLKTEIVTTNASGVKTLSLVFEAPADGQACTYGFGDGTALTVRLHKNDKETVLPGRHMSESQVADIAFGSLPRGSNLRCEFKDGTWEVYEVQKSIWGVSSRMTNADGKITVESTNATRLVLRVSDANGQVEQVKTP